MPTHNFKRQLAGSAGACLALLCLSAAPALAFSGTPEECEEISQPFVAFKDLNYYKLVPGGEFNNPSEGWELSGGAQVIKTTRPDGTTGGVLDVPGGAKAVSPPMEVTLQDPTARVWVRDVTGAEGVEVSVSYANTATAAHPKGVGRVHGQQTGWTLPTPFTTQPQIAGSQEGTRSVRFVLTAGRSNDTQLYGLWVDPRMRGEGRECPAPETSLPTANASLPGGSIGGTPAPVAHAVAHHQHRKSHKPSDGHSHSPSGGGGSTATKPHLGGTLVRGAGGGEGPVGVR
jgi:hypothetical protein